MRAELIELAQVARRAVATGALQMPGPKPPQIRRHRLNPRLPEAVRRYQALPAPKKGDVRRIASEVGVPISSLYAQIGKAVEL